MKKLIILSVGIAIAIFACKKDEDNNDGDKTIPRVTAMPLAVGNYWVYEVFRVDSDGVATSQNQFDTTRITGTTVVNGHTYFMFDNYPDAYGISTQVNLRDSVGYLITPNNDKYYAEADYTSTLAYATSTVPNYTISTKMDWKDHTHSVPTGTYTNTGTFLSTINITEPNYPWNTQRNAYTVFAKDVGIIKRRYFFFNSPDYIELRLVDFDLQ